MWLLLSRVCGFMRTFDCWLIWCVCASGHISVGGHIASRGAELELGMNLGLGPPLFV